MPLDIVATAIALHNVQIIILTIDAQLYYIDLEAGFTLADIYKIIPPEEIENQEPISVHPRIDLFISNKHRDILDETIRKVCNYYEYNVSEHNLLVNLLLNIFECKN